MTDIAKAILCVGIGGLAIAAWHFGFDGFGGFCAVIFFFCVLFPDQMRLNK